MNIKTSHIIWGGALLVLLSQGENLRGVAQKNNDIKSANAAFNDRVRENRAAARQAEKLSKVALDRYRSNCIMVVDEATGQESYFNEGQPVVDKKLGRRLRTGAFICNRDGDTALVSEAGTITDIARVATPDLETLNQLLEKRK